MQFAARGIAIGYYMLVELVNCRLPLDNKRVVPENIETALMIAREATFALLSRFPMNSNATLNTNAAGYWIFLRNT